ncbi:MAG: PilN domain-containing protein [Planctomycetales bacterium]|nr:PilN domain-containing protein [Planctomycetales bacterium]
MYINLLSQEYQRRQIVRARTRQWVVVWLILLPVFSAGGLMEWSRYQASVTELATAEARYAPLVELQDHNDALRSQLNMLRQREQLVLEASGRRSLLDVLGYVSRAAADADDRLCVQQLLVGGTKQRLGATNDSAGEPLGVVTMQGVGMDNTAVSHFVNGLRSTQAFRQVQLKSTTPTEVAELSVRGYVVECTY